jgi:hypothetical protein
VSPPAARTQAGGSAGDSADGDHLDYEVAGTVGVRLFAPTATDATTARRVLGEPSRPLDRAPELTVRFTPQLIPSGLSWVETGAVGFSDEGLFVYRVGRTPARFRLSFDGAGGAWELLCESGRPSLPLLLAIVRLAALRRGVVPLHAAAFVVNGHGVIASGWSHGGKTSALLAFMERGARYVADDWVLVSPDGARMWGLPGPVTISDAHARSPLVRIHARGTEDVLRSAAGWAGRTFPWSLPARTRAGTVADAASKVGRALIRRAERHFDPEQLFGERVRDAEPHVLFLMMRHQATDVRVEPIDAARAATCLASAGGQEELPLLSLCHAYRFAFPDSMGVRFVDEAPALRERLLRAALGRLRTYVVRHPIGVDSGALYQAMSPLIGGAP